jgi:hypothetical protein
MKDQATVIRRDMMLAGSATVTAPHCPSRLLSRRPRHHQGFPGRIPSANNKRLFASTPEGGRCLEGEHWIERRYFRGRPITTPPGTEPGGDRCVIGPEPPKQ